MKEKEMLFVCKLQMLVGNSKLSIYNRLITSCFRANFIAFRDGRRIVKKRKEKEIN